MRVVVTRPERETRRWAADLSARGFEALALPLIKLVPIDDPAELRRVGQQIGEYAGVMFVSANAADHFFASNPALAGAFGAGVGRSPRAWATGPGTARALTRAGVATGQIDVPGADAAQFDSEALWQIVGAQLRPGERALIVRGSDEVDPAQAPGGSGRDWFSRRLLEAGARVDFVVAYRRCAPEFSASERDLAREAAADGSVWLFSSAQAVRNLLLCLPAQGWGAARALATHARIAQAARSAGFGLVRVSRPTLSDVLAALKSYDET